MKAKVSLCLECNEVVQGRADKKFCSDSCRVAHHNQRRITESHSLRAVNLILSRNRSILLHFLDETNAKVEMQSHQLSLKGFDFSFWTHQVNEPGGNTTSYCYDVGYQLLNQSKVLITRTLD
jgi:hypothetical protein